MSYALSPIVRVNVFRAYFRASPADIFEILREFQGQTLYYPFFQIITPTVLCVFVFVLFIIVCIRILNIHIQILNIHVRILNIHVRILNIISTFITNAKCR